MAEYWNSTTAAGHVLAALWTKTAAGTDAAPVFSSTEAGTAGGMDCMLFELNGANGTTDTSGSYSSSGSGTANGTLTGMTATTGAVPRRRVRYRRLRAGTRGGNPHLG